MGFSVMIKRYGEDMEKAILKSSEIYKVCGQDKFTNCITY